MTVAVAVVSWAFAFERRPLIRILLPCVGSPAGTSIWVHEWQRGLGRNRWRRGSKRVIGWRGLFGPLVTTRGGGRGCGSGGQSGHEPPDPAHPHRRGREAEHGGHRHELVSLQKKELQGKTKGSRQSTTVQLPTAIRCMQVAVSMEELPETCLAGGGANGLELRRPLWLEAGSVRQRRRAKTGPAAAPCTIITAALLSPRCMEVARSMEKPSGTCLSRRRRRR